MWVNIVGQCAGLMSQKSRVQAPYPQRYYIMVFFCYKLLSFHSHGTESCRNSVVHPMNHDCRHVDRCMDRVDVHKQCLPACTNSACLHKQCLPAQTVPACTRCPVCLRPNLPAVSRIKTRTVLLRASQARAAVVLATQASQQTARWQQTGCAAHLWLPSSGRLDGDGTAQALAVQASARSCQCCLRVRRLPLPRAPLCLGACLFARRQSPCTTFGHAYRGLASLA